MPTPPADVEDMEPDSTRNATLSGVKVLREAKIIQTTIRCQEEVHLEPEVYDRTSSGRYTFYVLLCDPTFPTFASSNLLLGCNTLNNLSSASGSDPFI